jgi:hypothetical protein
MVRSLHRWTLLGAYTSFRNYCTQTQSDRTTSNYSLPVNLSLPTVDLHQLHLLSIIGLNLEVDLLKRRFRQLRKIRISCQFRRSKCDYRLRQALRRYSKSSSPRSLHQRRQLHCLYQKVKHVMQSASAAATERQCKICMDHDIDTIITPCQHAVACSSCTKQCTHCPICRGPIRSTNKVFW